MPSLNQLSGTSTFTGSVASAQTIDYTFSLSNRGSFSAALTGLSGDADLQLRSSSNPTALISESKNPGAIAETTNQILDAGTYTLTVKTASTTNVSYSLSLSGGLSKNLVWRNNETDQSVFWNLNGTDLASWAFLGNSPALGKQNDWKVLGVGDFNADGESDYLWRNQKTDQTAIWYVKNGAYTNFDLLANAPLIGANSDWNIVGVADFSGDGQSDLLWRNQKTDQTAFWTIKNGAYQSWALLGNSPSIGTNSPWKIVGTGDFDGDGQNDFLWRNQQSDQTVIWKVKNGAFVSWAFVMAPAIGANSSWNIQAASDFNGDGKADILWKNSVSGATSVWFMNDNQYQSFTFLGNAPNIADRNWQIVGVGQQLGTTFTTGGSSLQTALDIGTLNGPATYTDALKTGQSAFYKFTLASSTVLQASLKDSPNATIQLIDSNGTAVSTGTTASAGTYYAKVTSNSTNNSRYEFSLSTVAQASNPIKQFDGRYLGPVGMGVDSGGNIYIASTGGFSIQGNYVSGSNITKYDSKGNQIWVSNFQSPFASEEAATGIAVDKNGNTYISGYTSGILGAANIGKKDAIIAKYDTNGNKTWVKQFGTILDDKATGVSVDSNGNIYVSGATNGALRGTKAGDSDAFVARYDSDGNQIWLQQFSSTYTVGGGLAYGEDSANIITTDGSGNVYLGGTYNSSFVRTGGFVFLSKYDSNGNRLWLKSADDVSPTGTANTSPTGIDFYTAFTADASGNVYMTGSGRSSVVNGGDDSIVAKYDTNGNRLWVKSFGTIADNISSAKGDEVTKGIAVDNNGNIYVSGSTTGAFSGTNTGRIDPFVAKLDSSGNKISAKQFANASPGFLGSNGLATNVAVNAQGKVYVVGVTSGTYPGNTLLSGSSFIYGETF